MRPGTRLIHEYLRDKKDFPPKNAVLFVGSSSFRGWKTLKEDMEGMTVINRGFGGSTFPDLLN